MILKFITFSFLLIYLNSQNTCSAYCDFYFNGISNGLGCTG